MRKLVVSFALLVSSSAFAAAPIVGGTPVPPGAWPDVVAVLAPTAACSGTLIAPDVVLTAGHCIAKGPRLVVANSVDFGEPGGEVIAVAHAYAYPRWDTTYDVGVLVLERPAHVAPRAIEQGCAIAGVVDAVGFGLTTPGGTNTRLNEAWLVVDDPSCTAPACNAAVAPDGELVAGGGGEDVCFGDSGGPAFVIAPGGPALAGVTSRAVAHPCGGGAVFVRADAVVPWIEQVTERTVARLPCDDPEPSGGCCASGDIGGLGALAIVLSIWLARRRTE